MLTKKILLLLMIYCLWGGQEIYAGKRKVVKKQSTQVNLKKKRAAVKQKSGKHKKGSKQFTKGGLKHTIETDSLQLLTNKDSQALAAPLQLIAQNKEKARISDSVHKTFFVGVKKEEEEGYFASLFSAQKKSASFQTLEGTAAVFKSISGWQDKKFYVLTNQLPVGTIVRVTTSDLKSICAKVINVLPEVGNAVQYRLNDAAAAILGITNKTFQVSVTY